MSISGFFKKIFSPIINFFRGIDKKKAEQVINQISSLVDFALPVVELVSKLTPTPTDDLIIASLKSLGLSANQIINASSNIYHDGARLALATEALRLRLVELVATKGKVQIDDFVLRTASDVLKLDSSILRSAVQSAYSLFKVARK
jgi:hypothetical protein